MNKNDTVLIEWDGPGCTHLERVSIALAAHLVAQNAAIRVPLPRHAATVEAAR